MAFYTMDDGIHFITVDTGPLTKVIITDLVQHLTGVGYAKLNLEDTYDSQFGIDLAGARAFERLQKKKVRQLVKSTK